MPLRVLDSAARNLNQRPSGANLQDRRTKQTEDTYAHVFRERLLRKNQNRRKQYETAKHYFEPVSTILASRPAVFADCAPGTPWTRTSSKYLGASGGNIASVNPSPESLRSRRLHGAVPVFA